MRRTYRYIDGELVEVQRVRREPKFPAIHCDIPEYESPIDGRIISSRKERREDLKRSGCRPYEGFESEHKEAMKFREEQDKKFEDNLDGMIEKTYYQLRDGMTEPATEIKPSWILGED